MAARKLSEKQRVAKIQKLEKQWDKLESKIESINLKHDKACKRELKPVEKLQTTVFKELERLSK